MEESQKIIYESQSQISCRLNIHELFYNTNSNNQLDSDKLAAPLSDNHASQILHDWFGYFLLSLNN